jgi:hypothetical protein
LHLGNLKGRDHYGDGCIAAENNMTMDFKERVALDAGLHSLRYVVKAGAGMF